MLYLQAIDPGSLDLLKKLMAGPGFRDFILVGGTGLALQLGHRLSDDLDLFSEQPFEPLQLLALLEPYGKVIVTGEAVNTLNCFINGIKVDFLRYPYPLISDLFVEDEIRIAGIPDITAMKLSAIAQRGSRKDFYDLNELMNQYPLSELLLFFKNKFPSVDTFHILRSLTYFDDADQEKDPVVLRKVNWSQVKTNIIRQVKTNS